MLDTADIARTLAELRRLGLERVETPFASAQAARVEARAWRVELSRPAMDTLVSVTALGPSQQRLETAIDRAFEEMDRLVALLSRHDGASPVSHLNDAGHLDGPPPEVAEVVGQALGWHRLTHGAFDPTVAPLVDLFQDRLTCATPAQPTAAEIADARALVGARHVEMSRRRIGFARPAMRVTLDGIAKGYIVDGIAATLDRLGVRRYLVNAGGDIRTRGTREGRSAWTVAVQDPWRSDGLRDVIHLRTGAVATSGSYLRYFDHDRAYHHIVDAATGRSPDHCTSVSVVAPTAMAADALATSAFVMGPRNAAAFIGKLSGCACLVFDREGREHRSPTWRSAAPIEPREAGS